MKAHGVCLLAVFLFMLLARPARAQLQWDARRPGGWTHPEASAAVAADPDTVEGQYLAAVALMQQGRFARARRRLEDLSKKHPQTLLEDKITFRIAECLYYEKRYTQARDKLRNFDFSPEGVLYGWGRDQGLYTIDTSSAEIADVNPVAVGPFLQSIVFTPQGELLGVRNDRGVDGLIEEIYEIDPETGAAAPRATGIRRDLRGLVFIP